MGTESRKHKRPKNLLSVSSSRFQSQKTPLVCKDWYFWSDLVIKSEKYNLNPYTMAALIKTESNGNPLAVRYEPKYIWLYHIQEISKDVGCTEQTMVMMQKTSWGLGQIMGAVFYEEGGENEHYEPLKWATCLLDPVINMEYCFKFWRKLQDRWGGNNLDIYAAYNSGSPKKNEDGLYLNDDNVKRFSLNYLEVINGI